MRPMSDVVDNVHFGPLSDIPQSIAMSVLCQLRFNGCAKNRRPKIGRLATQEASEIC